MKDDFLDLFDTPKKGKKRSQKRLLGIPNGKYNFNKSDISKYIDQKTGISQTTAKDVINRFCEFVKFFAGEEDCCVTLAGFGSFRTKKYKYKAFGKSGSYEKLTFKASKK